ncbi:MAG: hypothetical protein ACR2NW_02100 [Thermodesulfobacteriota bacterium]
MNNRNYNQEILDFISGEKSRLEQELEKAFNAFNSKCKDICKIKGISMIDDTEHPPNVKCKIDFNLIE